MATDISSEFPELIGKSMSKLSFNELNCLCKLPKLHFIISKYITQNPPLIYCRILQINDYSAVYKTDKIKFIQYTFTYIRYVNHYSDLSKTHFVRPDSTTLISNYITSVSDDPRVKISENQSTLEYDFSHFTCENIQYDSGDKIQIIKWYPFEDLTVSMWMVLPLINKKYQIDFIKNTEFSLEISNEGANEEIEPIKIYGFNSELLKEIDRFSWMRRRSAIIRLDEF